jgi:hypothetical protein
VFQPFHDPTAAPYSSKQTMGNEPRPLLIALKRSGRRTSQDLNFHSKASTCPYHVPIAPRPKYGQAKSRAHMKSTPSSPGDELIAHLYRFSTPEHKVGF